MQKQSNIYANMLKNGEKKKSKPAQQQAPNTKNIAPFKYIKQVKRLIESIKQHYTNIQINAQVQLQTLRQLSELCYYVSRMRVQFVPYCVSIEDIGYLVELLCRISMHKEICICLLAKIIQSYFYMQIRSSQNQLDVSKQQNEFVKIVEKYVNLSQFCLQLNNSPKSIVFKVLMESLVKIKSWCMLKQISMSIGNHIAQILQNNYSLQSN